MNVNKKKKIRSLKLNQLSCEKGGMLMQFMKMLQTNYNYSYIKQGKKDNKGKGKERNHLPVQMV